MAKLEVSKLNKKYSGGAQALTEVSFTADGVFVVVGSEKSGKTTLLKCIAGLESCEGSILLNGAGLNAVENRNTLMLFDDYALFLKKDVYYNLAYPLNLRGEERSVIDKKVRDAAEAFGLLPLLYTKTKLLTQDEKRAVALARLLIREADVYLLDDPLKGLYGSQREELFVKLRSIIKTLKGVVIYATALPEEALAAADQIMVLNLGYVKQVGDRESLCRRPQSTVVAKLFADMNIAEGRLTKDVETLFAEFYGYRFALPAEIKNRLVSESYVGKEVLLGFGRQDVFFDGGGIEAEVIDITAKKGGYDLALRLNDCDFIMSSTEKFQKTVKININLQNICIFDKVAEASVLK